MGTAGFMPSLGGHTPPFLQNHLYTSLSDSVVRETSKEHECWEEGRYGPLRIP